MTEDQIREAAQAFNAMLRYEIGAESYESLCRADPGTETPHDHCDANMILLAAIQHVTGCTEGEAVDIACADAMRVSDYVQEIAEQLRDKRPPRR